MTADDVTFARSFERLGTEGKRQWRMLGVFPETFDPAGAAAIWGTDEKAAEDFLKTLFQQAMVEWDGQNNRYYLREMMSDFARQRMSAAELYYAGSQHAQHYLNILGHADDLYLDGGERSVQGLALLDLERENIEAGQSWASRFAADDDHAADLCSKYANAGAHCLNQRQNCSERIRWREAALAAAMRLKDRSAERGHVGNLAIAYRNLGDYRRAIEYFERHLLIARELKDGRGEEQDLANLGDAYEKLGEYGYATGFYDQYLQQALKLEDRRGQGNALGCIGTTYHLAGGYFRAIEYHEKALAIHREIGDWRGEAMALGNLGIAHYRLGQHRQAIEFYSQQLQIARANHERRGEGNALWNISLALDEVGQREKAIEFADAALKVREEISDPNAQKVATRLREWRQH
jgi:tetratricopeptide (TPR) repeat protein